MTKQAVESGNDLSKRIFDLIQDLADFIVLLFRITIEIFVTTIETFTKKLKDISGEIVLITGTGHGIGRELALQYAAQYSTVICVDINEKNNEDTVKMAKRLNKGMIHSYTCDITDREAVLKLANDIKNDIGLVSVLVNNAGIMPTKPLEQQTPEDIRKTFDVNVFAHFWTLEAFLPHMKQQNRGHIVSISSMAGMVGMPNLVPYCASKYAVRGMMEALLNELREGPYRGLIKITGICPYAVDTGLCESIKARFPKLMAMLDPKEVAEHIVIAHRRDDLLLTLPKYMHRLHDVLRLLPLKCGLMAFEYIGSGVGYTSK